LSERGCIKSLLFSSFISDQPTYLTVGTRIRHDLRIGPLYTSESVKEGIEPGLHYFYRLLKCYTNGADLFTPYDFLDRVDDSGVDLASQWYSPFLN